MTLLYKTLGRVVSGAAARGNPLAKRLVARELRSVYASIPASPIVRGDFMIPDLTSPLPEDEQGSMMGDFELKSLDPEPLTPEALVGAYVSDLSTTLGSYGMGSFGFFGLLLGERWFVIPINGASGWISLDGRPLETQPGAVGTMGAWIVEGDDRALIQRLTGAQIVEADFRPKGLTLIFDCDAVLHIDDCPETRACLPGSGRPRAFLPDDDLSKSVFLSPSGQLLLY